MYSLLTSAQLSYVNFDSEIVKRTSIKRETCTAMTLAAAFLTGFMVATAQSAPPWDTLSDTWVATDALGRSLPTVREAGVPRTNKLVAIFYFLWLGRHGEAGPFDISKILAADPLVMMKPASPPWGPMLAPHHWGESIFGYYVSDDEAVIRKHAQMLADAGVDAVIFDVTNGPTYPQSYLALLRVFAEVREKGGRTPQVAFLCPFGDPRKVVTTLWTNLYQPGLHPELWFLLEGKPLILADPAYFQGDLDGTESHTTAAGLREGHTLGQSFTVKQPVRAVAANIPTWHTTNAALTLTLYRNGPNGSRVSRDRFHNIVDNSWLTLRFNPALPPGSYYLEASEPRGTIGWWSDSHDTLASGTAFTDGIPADGDRTVRFSLADGRNDAIRTFFTFRKPQPDYFQGPTGPDQWSWLEIYPQHLFRNARGEKEMMSVGVAQNAVGNRLGSMSEQDAKGRSFHNGPTDTSPGAESRGLNFSEQWQRALALDPEIVFITGWNEWIAGRFNRFGGIKLPVMFVDEFDQEHSRDIEPMKGGHGDAYYYQMVDGIRRFKGVRGLPPVRSGHIRVDGQFEDWYEVEPEFRDDIGDPVDRDHRGWGKDMRYVNRTGRNDIVAAKVSANLDSFYFYVRTRESLTPRTGSNWMLLFINADGNPTNGWLGYDFVVNRTPSTEQFAILEKHAGGGFRWSNPVHIDFRAGEREIELAIPSQNLGIGRGAATIDFKWADNIQQTGEWSDFTINGDAAPNDRFNYRAVVRE